MSWLIDTNKAISSLLKEAQKQIDKALDIKDDEDAGTAGSSAESCEVLSNQTSPGSEMMSPCAEPQSPSESVEVLSVDVCEEFYVNSLVTSPEIEVLGSAAATDVDSPDDSISTEVAVTVTRSPITTAPGRSTGTMRLNLMEEDKMNESNESDKTISMEMYEIRTVSDSTTSFEEILPSIRPIYQSSLPHKVIFS